MPSLITALVAYLVIRSVWNPEAAAQEMVAVLLSLLSGAILTPILQFSWNFYKAPYRILEERLATITKEHEHLRARLATEIRPSVVHRLRGLLTQGNDLLFRMEQRRKESGSTFVPNYAADGRLWFQRAYELVNQEAPEHAAHFVIPEFVLEGVESLDELIEYMRKGLGALGSAIRDLEYRAVIRQVPSSG